MLVVWMLALMVGRGEGSIVVKAWGDYGEILPLRKVIDEDSIGGSEVEDKEETKINKVLEDCIGKCKVTEMFLEIYTEKRPCSDGCNAQATALEELKAKFPQTPLQYLLGTAVDKCWEGCGAYAGLDAKKEGVSDKDKCKIGCTSMQKLQRKSYKDNEVSSEESKKSSEESKESSEESKESSEESKESSEEKKKSSENKEKASEKHVVFGSDIFKDDMRVEEFLPNVFDRRENEDIDDSQFGNWHIYVIRPWSDVNSQMEDMRKQLLGWFNGELESEGQGSESSFAELRSQSDNAPQWLYRSPELNSSPSFSSQASSAFTDLKQGAKTTFSDLKQGVTQLGRGANAAFTDFKAEVGAALAGNSLTTNLFWILIGSGMVLLLASFFSWIYDLLFPNKDQEDGDYYKLKGGASPPLLPSYADCVKADKASLRDVEEFQEYFKVNLGYPRPLVVNISEEKVPLEKNEEL